VRPSLLDQADAASAHRKPTGTTMIIREEEWEAAWEAARPRAMGAILDLAASVLAELPGIRLKRTPRMGDYSRVLAAVDKALGTEGLAAYRAQRSRAEADSVDSEPAGAELLAWLTRSGTTQWQGSMSDLLDTLTPDQKPHDWPKTPRALQAKLAKLAKPLRRVGVEVSSTGDKETGTRRALWRIERVAAPSFAMTPPLTCGNQKRRI
jgi:hypothetical protein